MTISIFYVNFGEKRVPQPVFGVVDTVKNQPKTLDGKYCWQKQEEIELLVKTMFFVHLSCSVLKLLDYFSVGVS